jgi:hypothetical protein
VAAAAVMPLTARAVLQPSAQQAPPPLLPPPPSAQAPLLPPPPSPALPRPAVLLTRMPLTARPTVLLLKEAAWKWNT